MLSRTRLKVALPAFAIIAALLGVAAIPVTAAAECTVVVTLFNGQQVDYQLPQGAPLSQLSLTQPAQSMQEYCPQGGSTVPLPSVTRTSTTSTTTSTPSRTSTSSTTSSTTPSTSTSTSTTSTTKTPTPAKPKAPGTKPQAPSHHGGSSAPKTVTTLHQSKPGAKKDASKPAPVIKVPSGIGAGEVPTPANPTFSFSLPGPAPIGVPNFFIDSFRIPPFLLPIYQAAGIEYDVPWQVLAGINEIETDYGRDLAISNAGAVGWMQFLPSTWKRYGVDANGDGVADPYNPVDAIFTAARYLHAAGASSNLGQAIFAYNHASWYVESVLLRAKLIGGLPSKLVDAITGLVEGYFPVAAKAKYADDSVERLAKTKVKGANAAVPIASDPASQAVSIFAARNAPVIAVNDGKIVALGVNRTFGRYIQLQDATGNTYTYAHLGSIPSRYPVPKPVKVSAKEIARELALPSAPAPQGAASAGVQGGTSSRVASTAKASAAPLTLAIAPAKSAQHATPPAVTPTPPTTSATSAPAPLVKERLFAHPSRPASYHAGGVLQLRTAAPQLADFQNYFSNVLHLAKNQYTLEPLRKGSIVVAGTILGRIAAGTPQVASHVDFLVRPAGKKAPYIDPKPILDGWKLLEATAVYRAAGIDPFFGKNAKNPSIGQLLLMSKEQLATRVLSDPHVDIYACGRRDIQGGLIDRRVLATIEFLSASSLDPTVSGLKCGHSVTGSTGVDAAGATGASLDISKINGVSVQDHQGAGSVTDLTVRRLLTLQGELKPDEIVSLMTYKGQDNTLSLPDHTNRIQVSFTPLFGANSKLSSALADALKPTQWDTLIARIGQITEPVVPIAPSQYAIKPAHGAQP